MKNGVAAKTLTIVFLLAYGLPALCGPGLHLVSGCDHLPATFHATSGSGLDRLDDHGHRAEHHGDCTICGHFKQQQETSSPILIPARAWAGRIQCFVRKHTPPSSAGRAHAPRAPPPHQAA